MKYAKRFLILLLPILMGCSNEDEANPPAPDNGVYFPPVSGSDWETTELSSLGWNEAAVQPLKDFLLEKNTKSFMILVNGRIVMEEYFDGHTAEATWQWNSAGKTLVSATTGIAQQNGLFTIDDEVAQYLGDGWTSAPPEKEALITLFHLLSMTSGLEDANLVTLAALTYVADAGSRWSYSNVFQKLMDVVAISANQSFESYYNATLKDKIGMDGFWNNGVIFRIYHSNTRSMARFGLLALHRGKWDTEQIIDQAFFEAGISSSQTINPSYGYFWWLNGKSSFMVPGGQTVFPGSLIPNAPADMYAAMGAEDQRIYVVPGENMVVVRMGRASDPGNPSFALSGFDNALWEKINAVID
jgi:CubicO group peptidase (beta-lactamase class C family)